MPEGPIRVLDAFGGFGVVWAEVSKRSGRSVERIGIDKERRPGCLCGDNRKWMQSMDLAKFSVIDLDAYGSPFDQVSILFDRGYKGVVFFTFIQTGLGGCPSRLLRASGITRKMQFSCITLFGRVAWSLFLDWLSNNGVRQVWHRSKDRKHYGCFLCQRDDAEKK